MSTQQNAPPAAIYRDGAVFAKVWRNWNQKGEPFYSLDIGRTYTDPANGKLRESRSFTGTHILKIGPLSNKAYESISQFREADRAKEQSQEQTAQPVQQQMDTGQSSPSSAPAHQNQTQPPHGDLAAQRDAVFDQATPREGEQTPAREPSPER